MFNPSGVAQRDDGQVTLYLSKAHPCPPVPFELQGHISADDWAMRVPAITKLAARYYKPMFERIWLFFAVAITLVLPLALYRPIFDSIYGHDHTESSKLFAARAIGFVIFFAALLLFWSPVFIWKSIGNRRVRTLLASYSDADAARSSLSGFVPIWKITTPGVFSSHTILTITTPPTAPITTFHPDAYLPAYIGKAQEAQGAYFYPYPADSTSREAGLPRMSVVGGYGAQEKV